MSTIKIHNIETGEVVVREMNAQELADLQAARDDHDAHMQAKLEAAAAKEALLERLGITEEEARLLLGGNI